MSTKIYDGLIAVKSNPFTVHAQIREVLEPLFRTKYEAAAATAGEHVGETWDEVFPLLRRERYKQWQKGIPEDPALRPDLYDLIVALQNDPAHTFNDLDFGYNATLMPNGRGLKYPPLVLVFSEAAGNDYRTALIDAGVVTQYGYWDNRDHDSTVTDAEWEQREKAWDKINVPSRDGLNITMPRAWEVVW